MSCGNAQENLILKKKWRMVKEVVITQDKNETNVIEKVKNFSFDGQSVF
jgi:hypothetical protein